MSTNLADYGTLRSAIELATRAPSVHNTQPWRWSAAEHSVHLYADMARWLPATDPDGRDLVVSCGAALHHARLALAAAGLRPVVRRLPNPDDPLHLAAIEIHRAEPAESDAQLASVIPRRRTDRRPYRDWPVPAAFLTELERRSADEGAVLRPLAGMRARAQLVAVVRDAAFAQEHAPGYDTELALWSSMRASSDGIPAASLPSTAPPPGSVSRKFIPGEIAIVPSDEPDNAELLVIGTASDDSLSRLRAGEALSAVLLAATEFGLASCPLSQPLEVDSARRMLRDEVLGGSLSPQVVIRVGWAPFGDPLPPTPRRPVREVIERR